MHIGSDIDDYKQLFYLRTITHSNKLPSTTTNMPSFDIYKKRLTVIPTTRA